MPCLLSSPFHLLSEIGSLASRRRRTDRTQAWRGLQALELSLEFPVAIPRSNTAPGDAGVIHDGHQPRAVSGRVALKPRVEVVGQADVMLGVFERLIEVEEVDCGH